MDTEHSNFPLQGRGDTKTPITLLVSVPSIYTEVLGITQESQFGHTMKQVAHFQWFSNQNQFTALIFN